VVLSQGFVKPGARRPAWLVKGRRRPEDLGQDDGPRLAGY